MKKCKICDKNKDFSEFYFSNGRYRHPCKECDKNKRYTIKGVLYQRWRGIVQRCDGKCGHYTTANNKEHMNKEEFFEWALKDKEFIKLYNKWKKNLFQRNISPSIDRIDIRKGYTSQNIHWITMRENNSKATSDHLKAFGKGFQKSKKVRLWKKTGEEIFFESGKDASKYFNKNRLAVTNNIIMGHKLNGWNCEWVNQQEKKMFKASEDIKYKKEVEEICKSMENRVIEICTKFAKGNVNMASLPAFWMGVQGDIDEGLKKAKKRKV